MGLDWMEPSGLRWCEQDTEQPDRCTVHELLHDGVVEPVGPDQVADVSDELGYRLMVESQPNFNILCSCVCSWFTLLPMVLLGNAASPCPGRPCQAGMVGVGDEDEEVGLRTLSSLLSPRSLDRLGLNDRWDVSSSKSLESRVRLDPDER